MPLDESTRETYATYARADHDWSEAPDHKYIEWPATRSLLPDVDGKRVLDAGCGTGVNAEWLVEHGAEVVGVDATEAAVEKARDRLPAERARVVHADLTEPLDFLDDESVDLVLCQLVLGHVAAWRPVFAEFYRVLRPGGPFVFSAGHPVSGWVNPDGASDYFEVERLTSDWGDSEVHTYRRPVGEHVNPLVETGFRIERFLEPTPDPEYEAERPERYEKRVAVPRWECVRSRKPA